MRVYLADMGHNLLTFSSDIYPIGAAKLAACASAHLESPKPVEFKLFREPQDLQASEASMPGSDWPDRMAAVAAFGEHLSGLGEFTRTLFSRNLSRSVVEKAAPMSATKPA